MGSSRSAPLPASSSDSLNLDQNEAAYLEVSGGHPSAQQQHSSSTTTTTNSSRAASDQLLQLASHLTLRQLLPRGWRRVVVPLLALP